MLYPPQNCNRLSQDKIKENKPTFQQQRTQNHRPEIQVMPPAFPALILFGLTYAGLFCP